MNVAAGAEPTIVRQVFPHWSITIPAGFDETFVEKDGYWHAWDAHRSVSLTSVVITDRRGRPVAAHRILKRFPAEPGERVAMPPGLDGWAVVVAPPQPARASRAISGIVAIDGRVLVATVTAEDRSWAVDVWRSISNTRRAVDS
jgi:hypothetical protein